MYLARNKNSITIFLLPILILFASAANGQIVFSDFEWYGDTNDYIIKDNRTVGLWSEKDASSNTATIYCQCEALGTVTTWDFIATTKTSTSSSNMMRIYLASENSDMNNGLNISIGNTSKNISLCLGTKVIAHGTEQILTTIAESHINILRTRNINDTIHYDINANIKTADGDITDHFEANIAIADHPIHNYMGITTKFSKTKATDTYYITDFSLTRGTEDILRQEIPTIAPFYRGNIVINEIMTSPSNELGLPDKQYIELRNATDTIVDISGWSIMVNNNAAIISPCVLAPDQYVTICTKSNEPNFATFGPTATTSKALSLTKNSGRIALSDPIGRVADYIDYNITMYGGTFKNDKGWSLERIDPYNISADINNWAPSTDSRGGTPSVRNSVDGNYADVICPQIISIIPSEQGDTLHITFSEPIDTATFAHTFSIDGNNVEFSIAKVNNVTLDKFSIVPNKKLNRHTVYELSNFVTDDYAGNQLSSYDIFRIAIAENISANCVIINEIMTNATPTQADFIEVYNKSSETYNLYDLCFGSIKNGTLTTCNRICNYNRLMLPGDYIVVCSDSLLHTQTYNPANPQWVVGCAKFSNIPTEGEIALCTINGDIIDRVYYSDKMHSPLLHDTHNVSLERILTDASADSPSNWTSASEISNYATPTAINSQNRDKHPQLSTDIEQTVRRFTPDGDGTDDYMILSTQFGDGEWIATMRIYSPNGLLIATPYNNTPMPVSGELRWSGQSDKGQIQPPGTYIVLVTAWQIGGKKHEWKGTCTIGIKP